MPHSAGSALHHAVAPHSDRDAHHDAAGVGVVLGRADIVRGGGAGAPRSRAASVTVGHVPVGLDLLSTSTYPPTHALSLSRAHTQALVTDSLEGLWQQQGAYDSVVERTLASKRAGARVYVHQNTHARARAQTHEALFEAVLGTPYTPQAARGLCHTRLHTRRARARTHTHTPTYTHTHTHPHTHTHTTF